ncbi:MAG: hypothetical protein LBC67_05100 [Spirochaetales bacterium]|jgi:hypothetical protein|nr:hypothetical protein [Spirochaetales bacterium]
MEKVSSEAKRMYLEKVKEYKVVLDKILQEESSLQQEMEKNVDTAAYKKLELADMSLNIASYYLVLNEVSLMLLTIKNESYLNEARKMCYKSIIYLESTVSGLVDVPYSDYKERLDEVENFPDAKRYGLTKKLGFTIDCVEEGFGANSKWKWAFVELEGRFAAVAKNLLNMKTLVSGLDPRQDGYELRLGHLALVKEALLAAAERYRERYELSTQHLNDLRAAIDFVCAARRLYMLLGETDSAETARKKADAWEQIFAAVSRKTLEEKHRAEEA